MRDLPPEMLSYVFRDVLADEYRDGSFSVMVPLCVSQVCRRWRHAALSFGELWSFLSIEFHGSKYSGSRQTKYTRATLDIFYTWLRRTKGGPINFSFICECLGRVDEQSLAAAEGMINTLVLRQHRWRYVNFEWKFLPSANFQGVILTNMPKLLSLALSWGYFPVDEGLLRYAEVDISRSSRLQQIFLRGRFKLNTGSTLFTSLTETGGVVPIEDPTNELFVHDCWKLLKTAPYLKKFIASIEDFESDNSTPQQSDVQALVLPKLQLLYLGSPPDSRTFLDMLTLPALRALDCVSDMMDRSGEKFFRFVQRSSPPLTYLYLSGSCGDENTLLPALRVLPLLEDLHIADVNVSVRFFDALSVTRSGNMKRGHGKRNATLCPSLRAFSVCELFSVDDMMNTMDAFYAMFTTRWRFLKSFRTVSIDVDYVCRPDSIHLPVTPRSRDYQHILFNLKEGAEILVHDGRGASRPFE